jgi:hypothetical protein
MNTATPLHLERYFVMDVFFFKDTKLSRKYTQLKALG